MSQVKPLIDAMKLLQDECKSHEGCENCPIRIERKGDRFCALTSGDWDDHLPIYWFVKEVWEQNYG